MQATLPAHRIETVIEKNGTLTLENLPFSAGESVEVIVLLRITSPDKTKRYPLRGLPLRYDNPFEPVALEDWDALK
jgi:hypothetical protein